MQPSAELPGWAGLWASRFRRARAERKPGFCLGTDWTQQRPVRADVRPRLFGWSGR